MSYRVAPFVAAFVAVCGLLLQSTPADACSPAAEYQPEILEDDTPSCLELSLGYGRAGMRVDNECLETASFESRDCETCQTEASISPGETTEIELVAADMEDGETIAQTYLWTLGADREGVVETQVNYQNNDNACGGCLCSGARTTSPPRSGSLLLLVIVGLIGVGFRLTSSYR